MIKLLQGFSDNGQPEIRIIFTGGTIDSEWNQKLDTATTRKDSIIPDFLQRDVRYFKTLATETVCMNDSRELDIKTQRKIIQSVIASSQKKILITTGTYLMPDIATLLSDDETFEQVKDKKVILTGGFKPINGFTDSDGGFNLGMSLALLESNKIKNGVYVNINGQCIIAGKVFKNMSQSEFVPTQEKFNVLRDELKTIGVISTGGTIDFFPDGLDGMGPNTESHVIKYLEKTHIVTPKIFYYPTVLKDSRELSNEDILSITATVKNCPSDKILVTCGIYNIQGLKKTLQEHVKGKIIVMTGSRIPLKGCERSDGTFNLGYAFGKLSELSEGVYYTLGGRTINETQIPEHFTKQELDSYNIT